MVELDKNTTKKLHKLMLMLSSTHSGEVIAAVAAIRRMLEGTGASFHDLAAMIDKAPKARIVQKIVYRDRVVIEEKIVYRDRPAAPAPRCDEAYAPMSVEQVRDTGLSMLMCELSTRERGFIENIVMRADLTGKAFTMTPKQRIWFHDLLSRHCDVDAANV